MPPRSGSRSSAAARPTLASPPPAATMPPGRPPTLGVLRGIEVFECLPYGTKLTRPSCAGRWRDGRRLQRDAGGPFIPGHEAPRARALQVEKCHGCLAGAVHSTEFPAGQTRPASVAPPGADTAAEVADGVPSTAPAVVPLRVVRDQERGSRTATASEAPTEQRASAQEDAMSTTTATVTTKASNGVRSATPTVRGGATKVCRSCQTEFVATGNRQVNCPKCMTHPPRGKAAGAPALPATAATAAATRAKVPPDSKSASPPAKRPARPARTPRTLSPAPRSDDGTAEGIDGLVTFLRAAGYRVAVAGRVPAGIAIVVGGGDEGGT